MFPKQHSVPRLGRPMLRPGRGDGGLEGGGRGRRVRRKNKPLFPIWSGSTQSPTLIRHSPFLDTQWCVFDYIVAGCRNFSTDPVIVVQKGKRKICQSGSLQRKEAINQTQKDSKTKVKATKGGLQALCLDVLSEVKAYLQAWCHLSLMLRTNWINAYPLVRFHQFSAIYTPYKRTPLMLKSKQRQWGYETVAYKL